ncbi:MAG: hypothetical protein ACJ8AT_27380 [Hyalangium sp.]|uniref:hypothetical protein n=1 Tax=Hyalangium sp. TaxID=2028555 RepID=UPI00389AF123
MSIFVRRSILPLLSMLLACASPRRYFLYSDLPKLEGRRKLAIAPGPWENKDVPVVLSDLPSVPDDLVLSLLRALMTLPGAADACDPNTGHPRADAAEYCVVVYRTPEDWRVSWPVRSFAGERGLCDPPYGGVDDADFGREVFIFGFAHNHPCGTSPSSQDLTVFPAMKERDGSWTMVGYAVTPAGKPARDAQGQPIPAWAWLTTGNSEEPVFYKWNIKGSVFTWREHAKHWEFLATCEPQEPGAISTGIPPPKCSPGLRL